MPKRSLEDSGRRERANVAKAANARERNIAQQYLNAGPNIGNLARAVYHWYNSVPMLGGQDEQGNIVITGDAPSPGMRSTKDAIKTAKTIRQLTNNIKNISEDELDAVASIHKIKTFLQGKGYRKRLENYYRDKGSSVITQKNAPDQRIGEQLYNIETAKLEVKPRGKLAGQDGSTYDKSTRGIYEPETHSIQIDNESVVGDVPRHESIHARNFGKPYLDNAKYKMRTRWEEPTWEGESLQNLKERVRLARYYGDVVEQEPRVLNTLAAMEREGYDINNLSNEQIYKYLYDRPIDMHGSDTQSLIDNYVMEDIPMALRNFKNAAIPVVAGWTGYNIGKRSLESGGK